MYETMKGMYYDYDKLILKVPKEIRQFMKLLQDDGDCIVYVVGGAVRDLYRNVLPHDYDLVSKLTPDEIKSILSKYPYINVVDKLGNNFGVVVVTFGVYEVEIATFRREVYGSDPHRPERVEFSDSLLEDLSRRDFTMNAMAIDLYYNIIDPFCGRFDVANKLLRTVGDAEKRYREDPLRLYRACRFVSQIGMNYVENDYVKNAFVTDDSSFIKSIEERINSLSVERVRQEMDKLITGPHVVRGMILFMDSGLIHTGCTDRRSGKERVVFPFRCLEHLKGLRQNPKYHKFDAWEHTLHAVRRNNEVFCGKITSWALLFHDVGKGLIGVRDYKDGVPTDYGHEKRSVEIAEESLRDLCFNEKQIKLVTFLIRHHMDFPVFTKGDDKTIKHWLRKNAVGFRTQTQYINAFNYLYDVMCCDKTASNRNFEEETYLCECLFKAKCYLETMMVIHSKDLSIKGDYIVEVVKGTPIKIQDVYKELIKRVQDGNLQNNEKDLEVAVKAKVKRYLNSKKP